MDGRNFGHAENSISPKILFCGEGGGAYNDAQQSVNSIFDHTEHKQQFNPYLPSGLCQPYQLVESIFKLRGVWCTFPFLSYFL